MNKNIQMLKVKLKSFTLKDIRSLKRRKMKHTLKILKKHRTLQENLQIGSPPKYIDPFQYHRIISDFIVIEELSKFNEPYFSALKHVIELKHIVQIDFFEDFVYAKFENSNNYPYSPLDLVVSRLRSLGDQKAFKLAEDILEYKELCLLIKNVKQYGYQKEILNSFAPKYLNFLKDYFKYMMASSITTEQMKNIVNEVLDKNKKNPVFFLMYDEYKEYIGGHLKGLAVNKAMRKLIEWKEFEIIEKQIWCVETSNYYNYLSKLLDEFVNMKDFCQELFINTKFGFFKIAFDVRTFFVVADAKKMVLSICVAKQMTSVEEVPLTTIEAFYNEEEIKNEKEKMEAEQCERNKMWNKLIDCYFDFSKKK